jgi:hypothetical protein
LHARRKSLARRLLSGAALLAQLLGLVHATLVQHITCPEHGDLVHVGMGDETVPAPSPLAAVDVDTADGDDLHERCLLDEDGEHAPAPTAARAPAPLATPRPHAPAPELAPVAPATPIYVIAPKNSPPV